MGEQKKKVQDFLKEETTEEYDFKLKMKDYYEEYNKPVENNDSKKIHDDLLKDIKEQINNEDNFVSRWFAYKTLEKEINGKKYRLFDCDNSNDTCELTKSIYYCLWGWEKEKGARNYWGKLLILPKEKNGVINVFGGDTMNSLGTTMIRYMKSVCEELGEGGKKIKSVKACKGKWESVIDEHKTSELNNFAKNTSCIGNFVLVPYGFNGYRGKHPYIKDYWDLSLDYLAYEGKSAWLSICNDSIEQKVARENKAFVKYINMFFLWDYVKEKYEVRPLFGSHKEKIGAKPLSSTDVYPKDEEEFRKYFENVNNYIKRRGLFMAAMLKIAVKYDERKEQLGQDGNDIWHVSDIYKYIVEKVFLTDKTYLGYKEVIETIKETIEKAVKDGVISTKIKDDIFDNILANIEKLKEDTHDPKGND